MPALEDIPTAPPELDDGQNTIPPGTPAELVDPDLAEEVDTDAHAG